MECGLGCTSRRTATEQKNTFHSIIKNACGEDSAEAEEILMRVQENLNELVENHEAVSEEEGEPLVLSKDTVTKLMTDSGVPEEKLPRIEQAYEEEFAAEPPAAEFLIDEKALAANEKKKQERELKQQVEVCSSSWRNSGCCREDEGGDTVKTYDVILRVKPEKVHQIKSETINGQKCLVIPMAEDEHVNVNGVNTSV